MMATKAQLVSLRLTLANEAHFAELEASRQRHFGFRAVSKRARLLRFGHPVHKMGIKISSDLQK